MAVQRQLALYGEEWSSEDLFFGVSMHLKDAAGKWFVKLSSEIPPHCRNMEYLAGKLWETYASQESVWEVEFKLMKRQQQPGGLLRDFANSLDEIGAGHVGIPAQCYVDAFIRGMNNQVMSQSVRTAGVQTLEKAVNYAVRNCGKYGQGCEVTDWKVAVEKYEPHQPVVISRTKTTGALKSTETIEHLDWSKIGLSREERNNPPRYDSDGNRLHGITRLQGKDKEESLSLAAMQAIAVATKAATAAMAEEQPYTKQPTTNKPKMAKAMMVEGGGNQAEDVRSSQPVQTWQLPANQQSRNRNYNGSQDDGNYGGNYGGPEHNYGIQDGNYRGRRGNYHEQGENHGGQGGYGGRGYFGGRSGGRGAIITRTRSIVDIR